YHIAYRMPGYPVFVAIAYAASGSSAKAVYVLQALLGGGTVFLVYLLGTRINKKVGLIAAALAAVDPISVGFSASFLSETPFTFFLVLCLWFALRIAEG